MEPLVVAGALDSLSVIRDYVRGAASEAGLDKPATYRLILAVDEIASNVVTHGYEEAGRSGDIRMWSEIDGQSLKVHLEDTGAAYEFSDFTHPTDLDRPLAERAEGGLGVYLAVKGVDGFAYETEQGRNRHTFVMNVPTLTGSAGPAK